MPNPEAVSGLPALSRVVCMAFVDKKVGVGCWCVLPLLASTVVTCDNGFGPCPPSQIGTAPLRLLLAMSDSTVFCVNFDEDCLDAEFVRIVVRSCSVPFVSHVPHQPAGVVKYPTATLSLSLP